MYIRKHFLYLIFTFTIALGVALAYLSYTNKPIEPTASAIRLQSLSGTIIRQKQEKQLLSLKPIKTISVTKNTLIVGEDSLAFKTDTMQGIVTYLPNKPDVWKNYWSAQLGESAQTDNAKRWDITLMKLRIVLFAEWDILAQQGNWAKLSDEQRFTYVLIGTIQNNPNSVFFIEDKNLKKSNKPTFKIIDDNGLVVENQTTEPEHSQSFHYYLLALALLLSGIAGLLFTKKIPVMSNPTPEEKQEEKPDTTKLQPDSKEIEEPDKSTINETNLAGKYIQQFYHRYGDFYTNIELLAEYPTDEPTKQQIKQRLIEMGLHAHSFARAYLFNYLNRPAKEPNTLLIYEQKEVKDLDAGLYKILSLDGQETNKRYRYLAKLIAEMTINSLEGALLNDTYVSAETFEHLK